MLEGNYVHLPLKSAMHAVNPVQRLRLLRARLLRQTAETMDPERVFHMEMSGIFHSVRDLHTNYLLPAPFAGMIAYLPFQVERYGEGADEKYIVTRLAQGMSAPPFGVGVEITHWNGMPIERAVAVNADRFAGSNMAARLARGVDSLTIRSLRMHLPPDEEWVTVSYLDADGRAPRAARALAGGTQRTGDWPTPRPSPRPPPRWGSTCTPTRPAAPAPCCTPRRAVEQTFGNLAIELSAEPAAEGADVPVDDAAGLPGPQRGDRLGHLRPPADLHVQRPEPGRVRRRVRPAGGAAAAGRPDPRRPRQRRRPHLRQRVHPADPDAAADHPGAGAVHLHAAEPGDLPSAQGQPDQPDRPRPVVPRRWTRRSRPARSTPRPFPITPEDGANAIGQRYFGPVVLITDARCYSATDIFAAGFQDHEIGPVLGVDDNTGAGGANVWTHGLLKALRDLPPDTGTPVRGRCPSRPTCGCRSAARCGSGKLAGTPVEDLGVRSDIRHGMTRRDVLEGNVDLLDEAGALLAGRPVRRLDLTADARRRRQPQPGASTLPGSTGSTSTSTGGRAAAATSPTGTTTLTFADVGAATTLQVQGFADGELVAARTQQL